MRGQNPGCHNGIDKITWRSVTLTRITFPGISYHIGLTCDMVPFEIEAGQKLSPPSLTATKRRDRVQVGDGFMVGHAPKLRSDFKAVSPHYEDIDHSEKLLLARRMVSLCKGEVPSFKSDGAPLGWCTIPKLCKDASVCTSEGREKSGKARQGAVVA